MYKCGKFLHTGRSIPITWQKLQTGIILTKNNSTNKHYLEVSTLAKKLGNIKSYDALQEVDNQIELYFVNQLNIGAELHRCHISRRPQQGGGNI